MAGTLRLRSLFNYPFGRGNWAGVYGGTSNFNTVTGDNSDGSYIYLSSPYTGSPSTGASFKYKVAPGLVPGGAKVKSMRAGGRGKTTNASTEANIRCTAQNISAGQPLGANYPTVGGFIKLTTSFADFYNTVTDTTTISGGIITNGGAITPELVASGNLVVEVYNVETTVIQISELWIDVAYDEKPVVVIDELGDVTNTTSPNITWTYTDDEMPQKAYDIQVLNGSTIVYEAYNVQSALPSARIPISLADGTYTVKVRAYQEWNYAGDGPVSDYDTMTFDIILGRPAVPTLTGFEEPTLGRTRLVANHKLNLLSEGAAEMEVASWDDATNAVLMTNTTTVSTGDRSLLVEFTGAGATADVKSVSYVPVVAGVAYGYAFRFRAYPGDALVDLTASVAWYDANLSLLSTSSGTPVTESSASFRLASVNAVAPVNAAYAKPLCHFSGNAAGDWHFLDSARFAALNSVGDTVPDWTRGGFAFNSVNFLSYGDSTMESTTHWTPSNVNTSATVVDSGITGVSDYQGNSSLELKTTGLLARRDNETAVIATGTALVINLGDVVEGDVMLALILGTQTTITAPSGWTLRVGPTDDGTSTRVWAYTKVATAAEPSTYTWTLGASGKHAGLITSYDGINTTTPIHAITATAAPAAATVFSMPATTTPHNGILVQAVLGRRAASTVATTWTSNLGTGSNKDAELSTTANTANEVAFGVFSQRQETEVVVNTTAVSGKTLTASASLPDAVAITVVLNPAKTTVGTTLKTYEMYPISTSTDYVVHAAVLGADESTTIYDSANRDVSIWLDLFDNNKAYLTTTGLTFTASPGNWKKIGTAFNLADNPAVAFASLRIEVDSITDNEAYYLDAISFYAGNVDLGYIEGKKVVDGPYTELQYSEDNGVTWLSKEAMWVEFASQPTIEFLDYEIASETPRLYRAFNWKVEEGNLLQSDYSSTIELEVTLVRVWIHLETDPEGTINQFIYDSGRDDTFDKNETVLQFAGREYGQAHFGETSERVINGSLQIPDKLSYNQLAILNKVKALVIYRDGRGRRVKGILKVVFTDVNGGNTASYTVNVLGIQPWAY